MKKETLTADNVWAMFAETDRLQKENAAGIKELRESIKELSKQIGGIDENIGDHAEQYFQNAFAESLTFAGQKYDEMISNMECHSEDGGTEFDIVLINGKSLAIIEVKSRVKLKFVKTLAKEKIDKFRRYLPKYGNLKAYLGIASFSFSKKVLEEAEKQGIGIIRQVGKSIEMSKYSLKPY
jgi:hypothetical protein